jgi:hypothetical protein
MKASLLSLALFSASAMAQAPALPSCWPMVSTTDYTGTWVLFGEGPQCRWVQWNCIATDPTKTSRTISFAGLKSANPTTTMLGRLLTMENATDANKPTVYQLMWRTYVTAPIDPICVAEMGK